MPYSFNIPRYSESRIVRATQEFCKMHTTSQDSKQAALYARVSNPGLKDSMTLEGQIEALKTAILQRGYSLSDNHIYPDAKSGFERHYYEREQLMAMLDAAKNREFEILVVTEFLRIGRDPEESRFLLYLLEKEYGIQIESLTEKYDDTMEGHLLRDIHLYIGAVERGKTLYRTTRGRQYRGRNNLLGQGIALYGYTYVDTEDYDNARYVLNHTIIHTDTDGTQWSEVAVVSFIFTLYKEGCGLRKIALILTQKGIPTRKGKPYWNAATIYQILTNRAYLGEATSFKWEQHVERDRDGKVVKKYSTERPIEEQKRLPDGVIPPLIPLDLFEAVQERLARNKQESMRNAKYAYTALLRAGRCKCSICGNTMRVQNFSEVTPTGERVLLPHKSLYRCYVKNGLEGEENYHSVLMPVAELDAMGWSFALEHLYEPQRVRQEVEKLLSDTVHQEDLRVYYENRLKEIEAAIKRLTKISARAEEDELAELEGRIIQLEKEERGIVSRLATWQDMQSKRDAIYEKIAEFEAWVQTVVIPNLNDPAFDPPPEDKEEIFRMLGIKAIVHPKGHHPRVEFRLGPPSIVSLLL